MRGSYPKMDMWAVSEPHASPGSTGSMSPLNPAAATRHAGGAILTTPLLPTQLRCSIAHAEGGRLGRAVSCRRHCVQGRTGDGIEVRQVSHLQGRLEAELGDGHIAHAVDQHKRHPLRLPCHHTVPWANTQPLYCNIYLLDLRNARHRMA